MKRFEIITEADARVLDRDATVELARSGHVTPLARDTLKERRITVVEEGRASVEDTWLAPRSDIRALAVGSDQAGAALGRGLVAFLRGRGLAVDDQGAGVSDLADYPDVATRVSEAVTSGEADAGIVVDGTGVGSAVAANKIRGIRAAMAGSETIARCAREQYGANVLTLGATFVTEEEARAIVSVWISTSIRNPKNIASLAKIRDLERR